MVAWSLCYLVNLTMPVGRTRAVGSSAAWRAMPRVVTSMRQVVRRSRSLVLARISHQRSARLEAGARRQERRGAIHRARVPTYRTQGDVHKLLPRAMAAGPFASSAAVVVRNAG